MSIFCWHKYRVISVTHARRVNGYMMDPVTIILYGCENCSKVKSGRIDGHWSADEITGNKQPAE